jgi:hypothetical protein
VSFLSINAQMVADSERRILYCDTNHPGGVPDSNAIRGTSLYKRLMRGELSKEFYLIGDGAYVSIQRQILAPFSVVGRGAAERANKDKDSYNFFHSQSRMTVECAFGILTRRFSILQKPLARNKRGACVVLHTCIRFHNYLINQGSALQPLYNSAGNIVWQENVQYAGLRGMWDSRRDRDYLDALAVVDFLLPFNVQALYHVPEHMITDAMWTGAAKELGLQNQPIDFVKFFVMECASRFTFSEQDYILGCISRIGLSRPPIDGAIVDDDEEFHLVEQDVAA